MHALSDTDRRQIAELLSVAGHSEDRRAEVAQDLWLRHQLTVEEAVRIVDPDR